MNPAMNLLECASLIIMVGWRSQISAKRVSIGKMLLFESVNQAVRKSKWWWSGIFSFCVQRGFLSLTDSSFPSPLFLFCPRLLHTQSSHPQTQSEHAQPGRPPWNRYMFMNTNEAVARPAAPRACVTERLSPVVSANWTCWDLSCLRCIMAVYGWVSACVFCHYVEALDILFVEKPSGWTKGRATVCASVKGFPSESIRYHRSSDLIMTNAEVRNSW